MTLLTGTTLGKSSLLTRASATSAAAIEYFSAAFTQPAPQHIPVVTVEPYALGTGEQLIRETRTVASGPVDIAGDTHFRYDGMMEMPAQAQQPSTYAATDYLPDGVTQAARYQTRISTLTSPVSVVKIKIRSGSTQTKFRIKVNGFWISQEGLVFDGLTAGGSYNIVLTFPTNFARTIQWEESGGTGFGGMVVALGATLTKPALPSTTLKLAVLGDSYSGGAGSPPDGTGRMETWLNFVGKLMGATSMINFGIGGTGYTTAGGPFAGRAAAILAYAPDVLIIFGSRNDGGSGSQAIYDAAASLYASLASIPRIIVSGPSTSAYAATNTRLKEATLAAGREFVDGLSPTPWITSADLGSDGVHPTFAGHKKIAKGFYEGFLKLGQTPLVYTPAATIFDDFARSDATGTTGSVLGSTPTGAVAWGVAGGPTINLSSQRVGVSTGSVSVGYVLLVSPSNKGTWDWDVPVVGASKNARLIFNYSSGTDHFRLYGNGTNWALDIRQNGQTTITTDLGKAIADGDHVRVRRSDADLVTIWVNGVQVYSQTVAFTGGNSFGLYGSNVTTDCRYDNVSYTPLAP